MTKPNPTEAFLAELKRAGGGRAPSVALLKALHILTRDGALNQDSRRKLKQVGHLVQLISPLIQQAKEQGELRIADHGAGKSYLGFMLYDALLAEAGEVYAIETREELVTKSQALAREAGFGRMHFVHTSAAAAATDPRLPERFELVTALHACDTATDDAIDFALAKSAQHLALVPCCQAEVAANLKQNRAFSLNKSNLAELWRHPHHTREFGSQITNVLRCLRLQASGYKVTVTELVGWEHSMKNELILASRVQGADRRAAARLQALIEEFGLAELAPRFSVA